MGILVSLLLLFSFSAHSFSLENIFQNDVVLTQKILLAMNDTPVRGVSNYNGVKDFKKYLKDPDNSIHPEFKIKPYFKKNTYFWFDIYTKYRSHEVVLHDKKNLKIIYNVLDFSALKKSELNHHTLYALQNKAIEEKVLKYRRAFRNLQKRKPKTEIEKKIEQSLKKHGLKIPRKGKKRARFYRAKGKNLRAQTGQQDNIEQGIKNLKTYEVFINKLFKAFNLPKDLLAISFLESSFNTKAKSKVGATGVWQFMRYIGRAFMKVDKYQDGRLNPAISTVAALHLLAQNKQILKRWDLAIPAYNSGTKHLLRARRKLSKRFKRVTLATILEHYKHPHIGFASKNFFSEFTALVYALKYMDKIYPDADQAHATLKIKYSNLKMYLTKCKLTASWFFAKMKKSSPNIAYLNAHFKRRSRKTAIPRGTILVSDIKLNPKKYYEMPLNKKRRKFPKNWGRYLKNQSCSTK